MAGASQLVARNQSPSETLPIPSAILVEDEMADDKSNHGQQDRSRVAAEQQYEVSYFADKHGISLEEARAIIKKAGPSRVDADAAANRKKGQA